MAEPAAPMDDDPFGIPILAPGATIAPGYHVVEHLRRGEALDVYAVFSEERLCRCIAKTVRPDRAGVERVRARLQQEGRLLQTLAHPMLVRGFETIDEPDLVVIVETLTGWPLNDLIDERRQRLPIPDLCYLGQQVAAALHYLHGHGFLHLDVRPANIVGEAGTAKLIDLSLARPPGTVPRGLGSRDYLAPEQARGGVVSAATDVWGLGVTLYEAATRVKPFDPLDEAEEEVAGETRYLQLHRPAPPITRWRRRLPASFVSVVHACLAPAAGDRPTVLEVWRALGGVLEDLGYGAEVALDRGVSVPSVGHQSTEEELPYAAELDGDRIHPTSELDRP